jgi:hypothetical protein
MFQPEFANFNEVYILCYVQFFVQWTISEKINVWFDFHVKYCLYPTATYKNDINTKLNQNVISSFRDETYRLLDGHTSCFHYTSISSTYSQHQLIPEPVTS